MFAAINQVADQEVLAIAKTAMSAKEQAEDKLKEMGVPTEDFRIKVFKMPVGKAVDLEEVEKIHVRVVRKPTKHIKQRLKSLRASLRAENISYEELHELQCLATYIEDGDVELLEPAGVPEFPKDEG